MRGVRGGPPNALSPASDRPAIPLWRDSPHVGCSQSRVRARLRARTLAADPDLLDLVRGARRRAAPRRRDRPRAGDGGRQRPALGRAAAHLRCAGRPRPPPSSRRRSASSSAPRWSRCSRPPSASICASGWRSTGASSSPPTTCTAGSAPRRTGRPSCTTGPSTTPISASRRTSATSSASALGLSLSLLSAVVTLAPSAASCGRSPAAGRSTSATPSTTSPG